MLEKALKQECIDRFLLELGLNVSLNTEYNENTNELTIMPRNDIFISADITLIMKDIEEHDDLKNIEAYLYLKTKEYSTPIALVLFIDNEWQVASYL